VKLQTRYRQRLVFLYAAAIFAVGFTSVSAQENLAAGLYARMDTSRGTIVLQLDFKRAPLAVINFAGLAEGKLGTTRGTGTHFYDGLVFHRVVREPNPFVIQGGDPYGTDPARAGSGGPGYTWPDEIVPGLNHDSAGVLSMANSGPDTNGSQFFITLAPAPFLDGHYTVFGRVVSGMEVVNSIVKGDAINKVTIVRVGSEAQQFRDDQAAFVAAKARVLTARQQASQKAREQNLAEIDQKWPNAEVGTDDIRYIVEKQGAGPKPTTGEVVTMDYSARLIDGTEFDNSTKHGPVVFPVNSGAMKLPGWDKMAQDMRPGEKRLVILPPQMAFGTAGIPGVIPPNSVVVLDLTLVSVKSR